MNEITDKKRGHKFEGEAGGLYGSVWKKKMKPQKQQRKSIKEHRLNEKQLLL